MSKHDVVWYWKGGRENGEWRPAFPGVWPDRKTADELVRELETAGYPARRGSLSIGPPEGPPGEPMVLEDVREWTPPSPREIPEGEEPGRGVTTGCL